MKFSNLDRAQLRGKLQSEEFDLLIIGGGITGSGIALDAVTRGMNTALVEMQDFAAGTSSRSTKLVHGGLRYLKQFEVAMVAEVGKERAIVYENGPHVTTPEWMLLPFHKGGTFGKFTTSIGLRVYDLLAGVKRKEWRKMLTVDETINKEPLVKKEGLMGGGYYVEYRTDDARLTIEVAKKAAEFGANLMNYAKVVDFIYEDGKVAGAVVEDRLTKEQFSIKAKKIVNAAGPWVDTLREKDGSKKGKTLKLTKGAHVVIDQSRFPLKQAVYFDTPDGRMVFAIPREGKAYVGTTDTFYDSDPVNPKMTAADRAYIIEAINYMFPEVKIVEQDVESSWAGVRPLIHEEGKDPSEISRKDEIWVSDSGLITIAGGKLTGYRKMAEMVLDRVAAQFEEELGIKYDSSQTKHLPISGGDIGGSGNLDSFRKTEATGGTRLGLSQQTAEKLAQMYGTNVRKLYEIIENSGKDAEKYNLPVEVYAMLVYSIEQEAAATPVDFLLRRTGAILFNIDEAKQWKQGVVDYMKETFGWDENQRQHFETEADAAIEEAQTPEM
ncbi:glycerol-3-phosphate dehydrogenase/oxidase [Bacillus sp. CECT 9360]|uniref:glycerol-3-phosphate dehydrogenase/oxidase n=1 Tax=Bacillus sp. CECT 9360 TaxID=2845821 RepID=UPI001E50E953|nr:glycerol-3-phosphate dehydrogenase/oxidase [Bacillus sp. CECT 9360]CAH0347296.1 Aerobic glycerol-3-phosphate dehydrogenase [Bacillus sp. CECT 9360]